MPDDKQWNEIDWISNLNKLTDISDSDSDSYDDVSKNDDDDTDDIPSNNDQLKQCRYRKAIKECAHYDINSKILTFALNLPRGKYKRKAHTHHIQYESAHLGDETPAN
jgi:hypothetical protein